MVLTLLTVAAVTAAAYLLRQLWHTRGELHREQVENRRLRSMLQTGSQLAQADLAQLQQLRHDLRHYLTAAHVSPLPESAEDSLRDILERAPTSVRRENWAVAALERHYQERAETLGFQADLQIVPPLNWDGLLPDLCLVVSNLIENSLEALEREGSGWVRARSVSTAGYFSLVVGNTCTRPLRTINGRYLSAKMPGRFGIGLSTVQEIAHRYGGRAEFTVENGEFRASVFLLNPAESAKSCSGDVSDAAPTQAVKR